MSTPTAPAIASPTQSTGLPERLARLVDALPDALLCLNRDWYISYANAEAIRISRLTSEAIATKTHWELYPETVDTVIERQYRLSMQSGQPARIEYTYEPFAVTLDIQVIPTDEGIALLYRDITAQRNAEAREREQAQRVAQVFEATSDAIVAIDRDWRYTYLNRNAQTLIDPDNRLLGRNIWEEFPEAVGSPAWGIYHRSMNERIGGYTEMFYPAPLNLWLSLQSQPTAEGIVVFFRDITEQKSHDAVVGAQNELLAVVQNASRLATWDLDLTTGQILWGPGSFDVFGHPLAQLASFADLQRILVDPNDDIRPRFDEAIRTGALFVTEFAVLARDNSTIWVEVRGQAVPRSDGAPRLRGMAIDITQRKADEATLQAEQAEIERRRAELETIYRTTPVGLALLDPVDFRFLNLNDHEAEMLDASKDHILGRTIAEIAPIPGLIDLFRTVANGAVVKDLLVEGELPSRPGEPRAWSVNYAPIFNEDGTVRAISTASIEITNQKKAEAALIRSEKLAAVGRLASSISHEINNPLEAITNLLYLIDRDPGLPEDLKSYVHMAQSELSRVSQIATQTLRFHRQAVAPTSVTAADLVNAVIHLYTGRLANSSILVETRFSADTTILCFENDIRQVLNNLIANAIDAMRTGGRLIVRAHAVTSPAGIRITIADTGHGMTPTVRNRLFEPFFTTKDLNGTGLGLWISKGIVDRHQGRLSVRSSTDPTHHGTVFTLFLPSKEVAAS